MYIFYAVTHVDQYSLIEQSVYINTLKWKGFIDFVDNLSILYKLFALNFYNKANKQFW